MSFREGVCYKQDPPMTTAAQQQAGSQTRDLTSATKARSPVAAAAAPAALPCGAKEGTKTTSPKPAARAGERNGCCCRCEVVVVIGEAGSRGGAPAGIMEDKGTRVLASAAKLAQRHRSMPKRVPPLVLPGAPHHIPAAGCSPSRVPPLLPAACCSSGHPQGVITHN